jgi:hypothetical protein
MKTRIAARINWLVDAETREVYATTSTAPAENAPTMCWRCGGNGFADHGNRRAVYFSVRDRNSKWKNLSTHVIHLGCVPTRDYTTKGIPARKAGGRRI